MAKQAVTKMALKRFDDPSASFEDKLAALGGPIREFTAAETEQRRKDAIAVASRRDRERRAAAVSILEPGTMVRTDVFGWRYDAHRVVSDDGNENLNIRRVTIEKVTGKAAGRQIALRRDRVYLPPGN